MRTGGGLPCRARALFPLDADDLAADLRRLGFSADEALRQARLAHTRAVRVDALLPDEAALLKERTRVAGAQFVAGPSVHEEGAMDAILLGSAAELAALVPDSQWLAPSVPSMLRLGRHTLDLSRRVALMGVLNVTPDSFFDGGRHNAPEAAVEHALRLVDEGAGIIDVGGDSAGGRAARIDAAEEIRRVEPVIRVLARQVTVPIAVDTHRPVTAAAALDAGASMVNDITGLADPEMALTISRGGAAAAGVCVMHIKGVPKEFPPDFDYATVTGDVLRFLYERTQQAIDAGVPADRLVIDPGIEFGKLLGQDLELLRRLPEVGVRGYPLLVAVSRKHFIGHIGGGLPPEERLEGTAAAVTFSVMRGARILRVHDVGAMARVVAVTEALMGWRYTPDDQRSRVRSDGVMV
ncbi:MAG TPA: dihydropteroate synthase [Chloroflexota bacterium]|nr:dihydropteroate synthase [Chloroflexota bacterium]